jgi:hypothetical protein
MSRYGEAGNAAKKIAAWDKRKVELLREEAAREAAEVAADVQRFAAMVGVPPVPEVSMWGRVWANIKDIFGISEKRWYANSFVQAAAVVAGFILILGLLTRSVEVVEVFTIGFAVICIPAALALLALDAAKWKWTRVDKLDNTILQIIWEGIAGLGGIFGGIFAAIGIILAGAIYLALIGVVLVVIAAIVIMAFKIVF